MRTIAALIGLLACFSTAECTISNNNSNNSILQQLKSRVVSDNPNQPKVVLTKASTVTGSKSLLAAKASTKQSTTNWNAAQYVDGQICTSLLWQAGTGTNAPNGFVSEATATAKCDADPNCVAITYWNAQGVSGSGASYVDSRNPNFMGWFQGCSGTGNTPATVPSSGNNGWSIIYKPTPSAWNTAQYVDGQICTSLLWQAGTGTNAPNGFVSEATATAKCDADPNCVAITYWNAQGVSGNSASYVDSRNPDFMGWFQGCSGSGNTPATVPSSGNNGWSIIYKPSSSASVASAATSNWNAAQYVDGQICTSLLWQAGTGTNAPNGFVSEATATAKCDADPNCVAITYWNAQGVYGNSASYVDSRNPNFMGWFQGCSGSGNTPATVPSAGNNGWSILYKPTPSVWNSAQYVDGQICTSLLWQAGTGTNAPNGFVSEATATARCDAEPNCYAITYWNAQGVYGNSATYVDSRNPDFQGWFQGCSGSGKSPSQVPSNGNNGWSIIYKP